MGILKRLDETYLVYKQEQSVICTIKLKDQFICEGEGENIIFKNPFPQAHPV